jgi:hypothetical protein
VKIPRGRCAELQDNIKNDRTKIGYEGVDFINLAEDRDQLCVLMNRLMNLRIP